MGLEVVRTILINMSSVNSRAGAGSPARESSASVYSPDDGPGVRDFAGSAARRSRSRRPVGMSTSQPISLQAVQTVHINDQPYQQLTSFM